MQEGWRLEYRNNPYLRTLDREDLFKFGKEAFEELSPQFLKGVPKVAREQMEELLARFTHFLEEMQFRGIDMREWVSKLEGLKVRLETLYKKYQS